MKSLLLSVLLLSVSVSAEAVTARCKAGLFTPHGNLIARYTEGGRGITKRIAKTRACRKALRSCRAERLRRVKAGLNKNAFCVKNI